LNKLIVMVPMAALAFANPALAQQDTDGDDGPGKPVTEITITARRLDAARANIEPSLGAATYALSNDAVESRPSGETTTISQILLQVPGVAQDGSGKLRVRQSQGALQYRINNVILPEGLTDLGESLSPRIAAKVQLVTGALPAQYGLIAGGVVNITTKDGVYLNGGQAELYGGSQAEVEPAFEYGGSIGNTNFFASGSYLHNNLSIASPDGSASPLHDHTNQLEGLAYVDHVIGPQTRVAIILGASDERFQIPNVRGQNAATTAFGLSPFQRPLTVNDVSNFASEDREGARRDINRYGVVSLLHTTDKVTLQLAGFVRYSRSTLAASGVGDILFTGAGRDTSDTTSTIGAQLEGVYELADAHTLRAGAVVINDINKGLSRTLVLPIDAQGVQTTTVPRQFLDASRLVTRKDSAFLEDEWRPGSTITLNIGGRVDHVKTLSNMTRFSPRASIVWVPQAETTFHLGYARYFIPAPIEGATEKPGDLALTTARLPTAAGNAVLPEFDDYYDVGLQQNIGKVTASIDSYLRQARNLIDEGEFGTADRTVPFNYRKGRIRGVEVSLTYTANRLSAWANLAVADAHAQGIASNQYYFTASQLAYAASQAIHISNEQTVTASGGLSYRLDALRLSGDMLYGSGLRRTLSSGSPNGDHLPGYVQINLSAVCRVAQFHQHPLDVRIDIINALDRRYELRDGSALGDGQPQWGARRGAFIGVEQAF
jgi:hypothetical protein